MHSSAQSIEFCRFAIKVTIFWANFLCTPIWKDRINPGSGDAPTLPGLGVGFWLGVGWLRLGEEEGSVETFPEFWIDPKGQGDPSEIFVSTS